MGVEFPQHDLLQNPDQPSWGGSTFLAGRPWSGLSAADSPLRPYAPQGVVVSVPSVGVVQVSLRDTGSSTQGNVVAYGRRTVVSYWQVVTCDAKNVPQNPTGQTIVDRGKKAGIILSSNLGLTLTLTTTVINTAAVWVVVYGMSVNDVAGYPSTPQMVDASLGSNIAELDAVTPLNITFTPFVSPNGDNMVNVGACYTAPVILGRFAGVSLYATPIYGLTGIWEIGNVIAYPYNYGSGAVCGVTPLPQDPAGVGHTVTIYFVSLDLAGTRAQLDPTTAPALTWPNGIHG